MVAGKCQTLCRKWQQLVEAEPEALALRDAATGEVWSRAALSAAAAALPPAGSLAVVQEKGVALILRVLRAFTDRVPVFLVDQPQALPSGLESLPEDVCLIKTTSGSTGQPRHVLFTEGQLIADASAIIQSMGLVRTSPNIAVISMAHSYGFSNIVLPLLWAGIPIIYVASPLPAAMGQALGHSRGVTLPAVPAMWRAWHQAGLLTPGRVRLAISAGAPLPLALEEEVFHSTGLKLHNFYGSSECGGIAYDASSTPRPDAALAGSPLHGVTIHLSDAGLLSVTSPAVGLRYLAPDTSLSDGRFQTSDLATWVGESIALTGRVGDAINVAGRKISPAEIEADLAQIPGLLSVVVFGVPAADPVRGDDIVACLRLAPTTTLEQVKQAAATQLSPHHMPRRWSVQPTLAPDARGKISRASWRQRFLELAKTKPQPSPFRLSKPPT